MELFIWYFFYLFPFCYLITFKIYNHHFTYWRKQQGCGIDQVMIQEFTRLWWGDTGGLVSSGSWCGEAALHHPREAGEGQDSPAVACQLQIHTLAWYSSDTWCSLGNSQVTGSANSLVRTIRSPLPPGLFRGRPVTGHGAHDFIICHLNTRIRWPVNGSCSVVLIYFVVF